MSDTVLTKVDYDLGSLVKFIERFVVGTGPATTEMSASQTRQSRF